MKEDESNPKIAEAFQKLERFQKSFEYITQFYVGNDTATDRRIAAAWALATANELADVFASALEGEPEVKPAPKPQGVEFEHSAGPAMLLATDPTPESLGGFKVGDRVQVEDGLDYPTIGTITRLEVVDEVEVAIVAHKEYGEIIETSFRRSALSLVDTPESEAPNE